MHLSSVLEICLNGPYMLRIFHMLLYQKITFPQSKMQVFVMIKHPQPRNISFPAHLDVHPRMSFFIYMTFVTMTSQTSLDLKASHMSNACKKFSSFPQYPVHVISSKLCTCWIRLNFHPFEMIFAYICLGITAKMPNMCADFSRFKHNKNGGLKLMNRNAYSLKLRSQCHK